MEVVICRHTPQYFLQFVTAGRAIGCLFNGRLKLISKDVLVPTQSLPLNIKGNKAHPFAKALTKAPTQVIGNTREWPIAVENHQRRISKVATPSPLLTTTDTFF